MNARPYVGITGPVSIKEADDIVQEFKCAGYTMNSPHIPMIGFLASYKTLNKMPTQNRRYPLIDDLAHLVQHAHNQVLTMIHYNSKEMSTLADQIKLVFDGIYQEELCRAVQLNIVWPDTCQVKEIKSKFPELAIVFQASHKATDGKTASETVEKIKTYGDAISYVLIDPSSGRGIEFDIDNSLALYQEIKEKMPAVTIGFAGGFTGLNVEKRVAEIIARTGATDFCIDSEGGLRDKLSNEYGDDVLNMQKVREYVKAAAKVLR